MEAPPSFRSLGLCSWASILLHGPLDICLDWLARSSPTTRTSTRHMPIPGNRRTKIGETICQILAAFLVAHDCGYPLSRYTCRATRVAADFLDFIAFCRCSTGVALHPLKILVSHLAPPPVPGGVAPKFGSEKVSRYTGVSQLQLRVSRYTVQLRPRFSPMLVKDFARASLLELLCLTQCCCGP